VLIVYVLIFHEKLIFHSNTNLLILSLCNTINSTIIKDLSFGPRLLVLALRFVHVF